MSDRRTPDAILIAALRILAREIQSPDGAANAAIAEAAERLEALVEERRWISVGERLPEDEVWVDVAGEWGDCVGWYDGKWHNLFDEPIPGEVTHWRNRLPGPEGAIGDVFPRQEATVSGLRTERVVLEVTRRIGGRPLERCDWHGMLYGIVIGPDQGESVRVVEEAHFDDLAQVAMERDAAIRERDRLRGDISSVRNCLAVSRDANGVLKARVAELEAASGGNQTNQPLAEGGRPCDSTHGIGNRTGCQCPSTGGIESRGTDDRAAPTASGGEQEPVACQNCGGAEMVWCDHMQRHIDCYCARDVACDDAGQSRVIDVGNESSAPPQPRGWLTERDRKTLIDAAVFLSGKGERGMSEAIEWILARSTPPEVVLPAEPDCSPIADYGRAWRDCLDAVRSALAAAGVTVKEVGSE